MAITLGNFSTSIFTNISGSRTWNYNIMDGRSRGLFHVWTLTALGDLTMPTPTYNGVTMNSLVLVSQQSSLATWMRISYLLEDDLPEAGSHTVGLAYTGVRWNGISAMFSVNGIVQEAPYLYGSSNTANGQTRSPVTLNAVNNGSLLFFSGAAWGQRTTFSPDANYTEKWDAYNPYIDGITNYVTSTGITRLVTTDANYTLGATSAGAGFHSGAAFAVNAIKNNFSAMINVI